MSPSEAVEAYDTVKLSRRGAAAWIALDRPRALNAWNAQLGLDLRAAVDAAAGDDAIRAVVVTGSGRAFSSGADLKASFEPAADGTPDVRGALRDRYHPIITGVRRMPKPVIAAVNGPAAGIGCSLALACDLVLAAESAYFLQAFVNIGLIPDGGSTLLVPARVGHARAAELAMLGERLPARRALEWGLINQVHPDDELLGAADALAQRLAAGPTRSYAGVKRALNQWMYAEMDAQLELEATLQQDLAGSPDFHEGVAAFVEKRPPRFTGG